MAASPSTPKIGKYDVLDVIGEGGMGIVYKAVDPRIGRLVAIKKMTARFRQDEAVLQRFYREAQAAGTLQHPNIVTIYELGEEDGSPYLVMEHINGQSLEKVIESHQKMPLAQKLEIIVQICSALHYAHQQGVVHRDIKPANVMLLPNGRVKLLDFGIAHTMDKGLTRTGQIIGTLNYISPEQLNGASVDGRADIFATGTMMFQLLSGHLPFDAPETAAIITRILHQPVPSLSLYLQNFPVELDNILQRATAKECSQRYRTADDFGLEVASVKERLDREAIDEYLDEARARIVASDLPGARNLLSQVLKLDIQNASANKAMADVQRLLEQNENNQRIQQLRTEAQDAFATKKYSEAMDRISAAIGIAKTDPELLSFREVIQQAMVRRQQAGKLQQLADAARQAGQFEIAKKVIEDALQADPNDTQAQLFHASIVTQIATAAKEREVRELLENARHNIASKHFTDAHEMISRAEALDPTNTELPFIKEVAQTGVAQERHRRELERWCDEVQAFLDAADYDSAFLRAEQGLRNFPSDPTLVRHKAQAESLQLFARREGQVLSYVSEIEELLKAGKLKDAVEIATSAARKFPTDPRLQSVLEQSRKEIQENLSNDVTVSFSPGSLPSPADANQQSAMSENPTVGFLSNPASKRSPMLEAFSNDETAVSDIALPNENDNTALVAEEPKPVSSPAIASVAPVVKRLDTRSKRRPAVAIAAIVVVLLGLAAAVKFWPHPQAVPAPTAYLALDAVPWGTVVDVRTQNGKPILVNKATPVLVALPPGDYSIRMKGPDGTEHLGQVRVEIGQPAKYMHQFEAVDVEKLLESYR